MPPGKPALAKEEIEEALQAVIIADTFQRGRHWGPLVLGTNENADFGDDEKHDVTCQPWCLLPLLNQPLLAWTLEALAASGVEKVTVFVGEGVEAVRHWFSKSAFASSLSPVEVHIRYTTASSQGDVLRDADALKITSNFLLVQCGYLGNLDLSVVVSRFTEKRKADPNLVMDCVLAKSQPGSSQTAFFAVAESSQVLHAEMTPRYPRRKRARLSREMLEQTQKFAIRSDLESVGVDVCAADVPALFTENFDYQTLQPHFVNGILTSDLLGKTISCSIAGEGPIDAFSKRTPVWASLITTPRSYAAASDALLSRLVYPFVPDEDLAGSPERYELRPGRVYLGRKVDLARTCLVRSSAVGSRCLIGEGVSIVNSVLGESCSIAAGCTISNAYIMEGTHIAERCTIKASAIGRKVRIAEDSSIEAGSLVGDEVRLGPGARLAGARVSREAWNGEEGQRPEADLGETFDGHLWPAIASDEDAESDDEAQDVRNFDIGKLPASLGRLSMAAAEDTISDSASDLSALSRTSSSTSLAGASLAGQPVWAVEVTDSFERALSEGHTVDDAAVELKTMRMSFNVLISEVRTVVLRVLARHAKTAEEVRPLVLKWSGLLASLRDNDEPAQEGAEDILALQVALSKLEHEAEAVRLFARWLRELYAEDVVSPEAVLQWSGLRSAIDEGGVMQSMREAAQPLVDLCEESDEDDDDDEDEDD